MRVVVYTKSRPQPIEVELEDDPGLQIRKTGGDTGSGVLMSIGTRKGSKHSVYVHHDEIVAVVPSDS